MDTLYFSFSIFHLLKERGVKAGEITAVTFTRKAAAELKQRLAQRLPGSRISGRIQTGTFHSLCYALLKKCGAEFELADDGFRETAAGQVIEEMSLSCSTAGLLGWISLAKAGAVPHADDSENPCGFADGQGADALLSYNRKLREKGLLEFDDLLAEALRIIRAGEVPAKLLRPFSYLLVDEFQDINAVQYELIRALHEKGKELFVIGDPDQSIYGFRGSDSRCFDRFLEEFPQADVIRLEENYRSSPEILAGAMALISHNPGGTRSLSPTLAPGLPLRIIQAESGLEESIFIAKEIGRMVGGMDMLEAHGADCDRPVRSFSDIAVLYRTNRQARLLEQCLQREDIPYEVIGREDYLNTPGVRRILLHFRERLGMGDAPAEDPDAVLSLKKERPWKLLEEYASGAGLFNDENVNQLICMSYFHKTMEDMLEALTFGEEGDIARRNSPSAAPGGCVRLMTFHGSKGLEFPAVFLFGLKQGILPLQSGDGSCDIEEERRLLYVAMTRAKEELILTYSQDPSPFLAELPTKLAAKEKAGKSGPSMRQLSLFDMGL